jgi:hypothetical protein
MAILTARICIFAAVFFCAINAASAYAATTTASVAPAAVQQALATADHVDLLGNGKRGFSLDSSYYSGPTSGITPYGNAANLINDPSLYAMLIDGRYDFNADQPSLSSIVHPYILGGLGVAASGSLGAANSFSGSSVAMSPLFRIGGGVTYRLGDQWNLSLDYKAGYAPSALAGDQVVTGRNQQIVDLQALDFGMKYSF